MFHVWLSFHLTSFFVAQRSEAQHLLSYKVCRSVPRLRQFAYPSPNFCRGGCEISPWFSTQFSL